MQLIISSGVITLKSLKIEKWVPDIIDVKWEIEATSGASLSDISIDIFRTQAPTSNLSEWEEIQSDYDASSLSYPDSSIASPHGTRTWYYRIKIKEVAMPSNFIFSDYQFLNSDQPNAKWRKIHRTKNLGLKKNKAGRDFILIKKRSWGTRCEEGWDEVLMKKNNTRCDDCNCWGTGWRNGFFAPILLRGMISPNPEAKEVSIWGELYPSDAVFSMLSRPPLETGDIIVDVKKDVRYVIQNIRRLEMLGVPIEQQARVSLIHPDDEIYEYDVRVIEPEVPGGDVKLIKDGLVVIDTDKNILTEE